MGVATHLHRQLPSSKARPHSTTDSQSDSSVCHGQREATAEAAPLASHQAARSCSRIGPAAHGHRHSRSQRQVPLFATSPSASRSAASVTMANTWHSAEACEREFMRVHVRVLSARVLAGDAYAWALESRMPLPQETLALAKKLSQRLGWATRQRSERHYRRAVRREVLRLRSPGILPAIAWCPDGQGMSAPEGCGQPNRGWRAIPMVD
jgi:hypothetical protein